MSSFKKSYNSNILNRNKTEKIVIILVHHRRSAFELTLAFV